MADIKIFGTLHNVTGEALARANEIYDGNKTQSEVNEEIAEELDNRYTKDETYSQVELESMITPPEPEYIAVSTYAELQALTTHPNGAIYRVAHYDGTQVDNTKFAEYSWTGSEYKLLAVRGNALEPLVGYYECTTAAATAEKTITASNYILTVGGSIKIKMTNINTADNTTLNINSTGAKALYYAGERASASNSWEAGETVEVYYDGTSYYANSVAGGSGSGDGAFDVSVKYPTSGVDGGNTYTLEGALAVLNANLSSNKKKGGMSIKFIQSSDNKYVQYRLMSDSFNTTVANWQGVDDVPTAGSDNLVKSGGVANTLGEPEKNITYTSADYCGLIWNGSSVVSASSAFNGFIIPLRNTEYTINVTGSSTKIRKFDTIPTIGMTGGTAISTSTFVGEEGYYILITLSTSIESINVLSKAYGISSRLETDKTLTILDSPADAKIVGDKINHLDNELGVEYYNKIYTYDSDSSFELAWNGSSLIYTNENLRSYLIELKNATYIINSHTYSSIILFDHFPKFGDTNGTAVTPSDNYIGQKGNYILVTFTSSNFLFQVVEKRTGILESVEKKFVNTLDKSIIEPQAQYSPSSYEDVHKVSQDIQNEFGTKYCLSINERFYNSSKLNYCMIPMNLDNIIELTSTDRFIYYTFIVRTNLNLGTTSVMAYLYSAKEVVALGDRLSRDQNGYNNRIGNSVIGIYYEVLPYNSSDDTYIFKIKIELKPNQTYPYLKILLTHTFDSSSISLDEYHGFEAFYYRYWKSSADDYDFDYSQNFINLNWNFLTAGYNLFQYRKIVLLGTSIEATGYFNPVAEKFALPEGKNYISYAQGGGSVLWYGTEFPDIHLVRGFSCTLQEKIDAMLENGFGTGTDAQGNTYYMYPGTQQKVEQYHLNASYDISILDNAADTDLFIIGTYGINDRYMENEITSENYLDQFTVDSQHEFDRRCIYGAYNYVLDKLFTQNPRANVIIIGQHCFEWSRQDRVNEIQKAVARKWHIPFIEWAYELGITSYNKNIYIPDGMHPDTEGVKLLGDYLYKWLNRHSPNGRK